MGGVSVAIIRLRQWATNALVPTTPIFFAVRPRAFPIGDIVGAIVCQCLGATSSHGLAAPLALLERPRAPPIGAVIAVVKLLGCRGLAAEIFVSTAPIFLFSGPNHHLFGVSDLAIPRVEIGLLRTHQCRRCGRRRAADMFAYTTHHVLLCSPRTDKVDITRQLV